MDAAAQPSDRSAAIQTHAPYDGIPYHKFLKLLHKTLAPRSYLEIGVDTGGTFALSRCRSAGVDPSLGRLKLRNVVLDAAPLSRFLGRPRKQLFEMTSDDFFATQNLQALFPEGIDLAFLDGMHWFEFLLRDFINTERFSRPDSVIALHDCIPFNVEMAEREHRPELRADSGSRTLWAGDVWKILTILHDYRPDLRYVILDCPPTGLVLVTNLNPSSNILQNSYDDIIAKYASVELAEYGLSRLRAEFPPLNSRDLQKPKSLKVALGRP